MDFCPDHGIRPQNTDFFPLAAQVCAEVSPVSPTLLARDFGGSTFPFRWCIQFQWRHVPRWWSECILQRVYPSFVQAALSLMSINSLSPRPQAHLRWKIGQMYYVSLITAELFGPSNASRIVDLFQNTNNIHTPGYMIYENGNPTRLALFNFFTDPSGFSNYNATFAIGGSGANQPNASPQQVSKFCVVLYCTFCCVQRQLPVGRPGSVWQWC